MNQIEYENIIFTETPKSELAGILKKDFFSSEKIIYFPFNLDVLRNCHLQPKTKLLAKKSTKNFIDGIGISILIFAKYKNIFPKRITGSDIFNASLKFAAQYKLGIGLLGTTSSILEKSINQINKSFPAVPIAYAHSPSFPFDIFSIENDKIITELNNASPDLLFVFLGNPRQELWIIENCQKVNSKMIIPLGATLDFFSGYKRRAPKLIQLIGLEWLWRLLSEPRRLFNRYFIQDIPFALKVIFKNLFSQTKTDS